MFVDGIFDYESYDHMTDIFDKAGGCNRKELTVTEQTQSDGFAKVILSSFQMTSSKQIYKISPKGGNVTVSAETDGDGNSSATGSVTVSSDDGSVSVSASGSVDQDGSVSGKVEASISWDKN